MSFTAEFSIGDTYFVNLFDEFKDVLREHEILTGTKYVYGKGNKLFTKTDVRLTTDLRIHWLDDTPFFHFGRRIYTCHQGPDKNLSQKQKYHKLRDERALFDNIPVKRYKRKKLPKKVECPARVSIIRIYRMPEYRVPTLRIKDKLRVSNTIKSLIRNDEHVIGEEGYLFNIPRVEDHRNHSLRDLSTSTENVEAALNAHLSAGASQYLEAHEYLQSNIPKIKLEHLESDESMGDNHLHFTGPEENESARYVVTEMIETEDEPGETKYVVQLQESEPHDQMAITYAVAEYAEAESNEHLEAAYAVAEFTESVANEHLQAAVAVAELNDSVSNEHFEAAVAVAGLTNSVPSTEQTLVKNPEKMHIAETEQMVVVSLDETAVTSTEETLFIGSEQAYHSSSSFSVIPKRKAQTLIQRNRKRKLINDCKATMQSIQSVIWSLEENHLQELSGNLSGILEVVSTQVTNDENAEQRSNSSNTYILTS